MILAIRISVATAAQLVERRLQPDDRRGWYFIPTEAAITAMKAWFAEI